jgi:hypothetical protein
MHPVSGPPEILPHAVRVMAFFPGGEQYPREYRTFEYLIFLQANGASAASERALSILRSVHDDPENLRKLGSPIKPSFYAVVWVGFTEVPHGAAVPFEHPMIINYFRLEEYEVEALKTRGMARVPVRSSYVEE